MEVKKGYKQTEVGVIPEDWVVKDLGVCFSFSGGFTASRAQLSNDGYCYLHYGDIHGSTKTFINVCSEFHDIPKLNISLNKVSPKSLLKDGDIVFVDASEDDEGTSKHIVVINNDDIPYISGLHTIVGKSKDDSIDNAYKRFCFETSSIKSQFKFYSVGTKVSGISKTNISKIKFPLPPTKAEQTVIAAALSDADALIQSLGKLIVKKQQIKQSAMQELLKPKEGWVVKKLGEVAEIKDGTHQTPKYADSGISFYSVENVTRNDFKNTKFISNEEHSFLTKNYKIEKGDILMTRIGSIGDCKYVDWDVDASFYVSLALLKIRQGFSARFICHYSNSAFFKKEIELNSLQSAIPKKINLGQISHVKLKMPNCFEEQTRIASILSDMDAEIVALESKLAKYKQIKQGMIQMLLTGNIRLLNIEASVKPKATVTVMPMQIDSQKKKHNWEFNEAVVISVLTKAFGKKDYPLGRKRYTKLSYLLHRYAEGTAEGYRKKAAGPYNPSTKYGGPEKIAQTRGYIKARSNNKYTGFVAANNIDEAAAYFNKWYDPEALRWLEQFRYKDNDKLELLTTVDMAVQDLIQSNQDVSVKSVKALIHNHNEWQAKLKRSIFSDDNIEAAIMLSEDLFET